MSIIKKIIYEVTNVITGMKYIGATSQTLEDRKRDHLQKAKKKVGSRFQKAIASYPLEVFEWVQIDTASSPNELAQKEKEYVLKYDSKVNGYNADRGGGIQKSIYQYDLDTGNLLATFPQLEYAAFTVGVDKRTISKACLGEIKNCKGFYWSYNLADTFKAENDLRKKKVFQFTELGVFSRSYNSVAEASEITGVNRSSIAKCCRGIYFSAGDYLWEYQND